MSRIYHLSEWAAYKTIDSEKEMRNYLAQLGEYTAGFVVENRPEYRLIAVEMHPETLKNCPKSHQTYELVKAAVERDGGAIRFASKKVLKANPDLYRIAVSNHGSALFYVPEEHRYEGIYEAAVSTYGKAVGGVPSARITPELVAMAISQDPSSLECVPERFRDYSSCMMAVRSLGRMLAAVPVDVIDKPLCLEAVSNDGMAIEHVPDSLFDRDVQMAAVESNGLALGAIPARRRCRTVCEAAVASDALALEYVPRRFASSDMVRQAVATNGLALRFVENPSPEICKLAVDNDGSALQFVPEAYKTPDMCRSAFERNWRMVVHVPAPMIDRAMLVRAVKEEERGLAERPRARRVMHIDFLKELDCGLLQDPEIASVQRRMGIRRTVSASWDDSAEHFLIEDELFEEVYVSEVGYEEFTHALPAAKKSFEELCAFLDGNLETVDFGAFDFSSVAALPECVIESTIPSDAQIQLGNYDKDHYLKLIGNDRALAEELFSEDSDEDRQSLANIDSPLDRYYCSDEMPIYYISDIHLNHKLIKKFPERASANEIGQFIEGFVEAMVETVPSANRGFPLLILGDVSYNFDIAEGFFSKLSAKWRGPIVYVLGNHELWYSNPSPKPSDPIVPVETIVEEYREMLERYNVVLLENELFVKYRNRDYRAISLSELREMADDELRDVLRRCSTIILGGLGFTALSDKYTAKDGLYRNALHTLKEDEAYTSRFRGFYERIVRLVPDRVVIVATHTPMRCWSQSARHPGWVYLNGHTHRNSYELADSYCVYEDNQVGYHAMSAGLKRFLIHPACDVFKYHDDGIHIVNRTDYIDFCRERGIGIGGFTRKGDVIMLKRDGLYCFLLKAEANGKIYLLAGARIYSLSVQDPEYYFERMKLYSDRTKAAFSGYNKAIRTIGKEIERLGGWGTVHGCIVDIDFLNHIYLDPFTGELKYYYAESTTSRTVYPSLDMLLRERAPNLLPAYKRLLSKASNNGSASLATVAGGVAPAIAQSPTVSHDTSMYKPSGVVRSVQYLFDANVIRNWNEAVVEGATEEEIAASNAASRRLYDGHGRSLNP